METPVLAAHLQACTGSPLYVIGIFFHLPQSSTRPTTGWSWPRYEVPRPVLQDALRATNLWQKGSTTIKAYSSFWASAQAPLASLHASSHGNLPVAWLLSAQAVAAASDATFHTLLLSNLPGQKQGMRSEAHPPCHGYAQAHPI